MGRIIVEVMPKPEILDPQGKAVRGALPRQGIETFTDVRQGKRFELTVDGPVSEQALEDAAKAAESVLSNPIIEDVVAVYDAEAGR
ncbi:phosphoribosylformylglycinamidine synthase subunit PurS [Ancrocorticia populi]|uniref:Phosphoribosylformylglycinamidine synthase subunit PurS n=1 Tax=Ancrocorticia populi TaxID=2175228 RepID=A0A2V1K9M7_9ACTO|nr:phosphoribosylformylglycinamidine synthase subunit PurS [Ancrocorticia populi]MDN6485997.1 phosphoribosylformylglycinamidine synthase subunit PurS [Ancrocorticia sp.]PWF26076.1 phosphoribosylformylglycinamidine synthase, purS protein [Ancrocorticia populi]